jgi:hypothetical protein
MYWVLYPLALAKFGAGSDEVRRASWLDLVSASTMERNCWENRAEQMYSVQIQWSGGLEKDSGIGDNQMNGEASRLEAGLSHLKRYVP